jgi:sialidase-1
LQEPRCQASLIRYSPNKFTDKNIILFSNPNHNKKRLNITVKLSFDEGKTWPTAKSLYEGPSAYSCLAVLPAGKIACCYEAGEKMPYEKIVLATFCLNWLVDDEERSNFLQTSNFKRAYSENIIFLAPYRFFFGSNKSVTSRYD